MATYKVIQDIEAEDKLIGPFGIRQFIYLIIVAVSGFVIFRLGLVAWYLALPLLPHTIFFALLALPFGGDQPTETWLLAKIRFALKPRRRVWDQSGMLNLVTITAPKKVEKVLTHNLSEGEVRSRLEALANTIDSRGWAIKNVSANMFTPAYAGAGQSSDRLIDIPAAQEVPDYATTPIQDMMDVQTSPTAQNLDRMISAASKAHRDKIVSSMKSQQQAPPQPAPATPQSSTSSSTQPQPDYWFLNPGSSAKQGNGSFGATAGSVVVPDPNAVQQQSQGLPLQPLSPHTGPLTEEELLDKIHAEKQKSPKHHGNLRVIKTLEEQEAEEKEAAMQAQAAAKLPEPPVTPVPDPDIIELARNDDLNVETVARQAKKSKQHDLPDGEVVINLH